MSEYKLNDLIIKMIEESGYTGYRIEKESGITQHTTSYIINKKRPANWKNFLKYCKVLGFEVDISVSKIQNINFLYQYWDEETGHIEQTRINNKQGLEAFIGIFGEEYRESIENEINKYPCTLIVAKPPTSSKYHFKNLKPTGSGKECSFLRGGE